MTTRELIAELYRTTDDLLEDTTPAKRIDAALRRLNSLIRTLATDAPPPAEVAGNGAAIEAQEVAPS